MVSIGGSIGSAVGGSIGGALGGAAGSIGATVGGMIGGAISNALGLGGAADPDVVFRYQVEMGGISCVRFNECHGLKSTSPPVLTREGGNNFHEVAMVGPNKFEDLIIKKGFYSAGSEFYTWIRQLHLANKKIDRVSMSVVILNEKFEECGRFNLYKCFPVEYEGPAFNSTSSEIAFESMKIHYDFFEYHPGGAIAGLVGAALSVGANLVAGAAASISLPSIP